MHYRKAMRYELEYPDGEREVLLWVPKYDFNWQFLYEYETPKFIPAGSTPHMSWWLTTQRETAGIRILQRCGLRSRNNR